MRWERSDEYNAYQLLGLPLWRQEPYPPMRIEIWLTPRPGYCDRGRWLAITDAPLDHQEGWPRYYFDLETAQREILQWVQARTELRHATPE